MRVKRHPDREGSCEKNQACFLDWTSFMTDGEQLDLPERWLLPPASVLNTLLHPRIERDAYHGLRPGERDEILWPGAKVNRWKWGSSADDQLLSQQHILTPQPVPVVIPGGARCSFMLSNEHPITEPQWTLPLLSQADRVSGAPILTVEMTASTHWNPKESLAVTWTVTYHGTGRENDSNNSRPITFRTFNFHVYGTFLAYRQRYEDGEWEPYTEGRDCAFPNGPDDPFQVTVGEKGERGGFVSLRPGQSRSKSIHIGPGDHLPPYPATGEILRYRFNGCELDWWDWGTLEDHAHTVLTVPGFLGGEVLDPPDNGGRPKVVVPASTPVVFTVI
ncbi:uncharacterized protein BO97DRAFT_477423 [Aspergillus homomorphus CBS 101889]|uniref:Uncharacterized protein n=1 Tax=Aspergillus homomorphus (strain CBS 101889) TaxID=1450537 RepID=A0A395I0N0_ASPHC|nr:hypothetical protein BO97DRAFT_477423 [Aspergillus homomorphus CBS 101889]RAL13183.1 hypothetical protein BO97DRAFT_477423 [Aspergillus homomorphus CBS 101889]